MTSTNIQPLPIPCKFDADLLGSVRDVVHEWVSYSRVAKEAGVHRNTVYHTMNPDHPAFNARVFRVALKLCREEIERHNEEIAQLQAEARELVEKQS